MAKIKYSALVQEMRNKLNGSVASRNRYGNYFRNKTTPINPRTTYQQNQRSILSTISQTWRTLTNAQRESWNNSAPNFPFTDIFGDQKTLSGQALFVKLNTVLLSNGQAVINIAPNPTSVTYPGALTITTDAVNPQVFTVGFDNVGQLDESLVVEVTAQMSAGRAYMGNEYRKLTTFVPTMPSPVNIVAVYTNRFGALSAGMRLGVRLYYYNINTGQVGIAATATAIVQ